MSQLWSTPVAGPPALLLAACLFGVAAPAAAQDAAGWFELHPWRGPCAGNCAAAIYGG